MMNPHQLHDLENTKTNWKTHNSHNTTGKYVLNRERNCFLYSSFVQTTLMKLKPDMRILKC